MGVVWSAVHDDGTPVAVKVLEPRAGRELADLLEQEVRAMAGLDHPHVLRVFDRGVVPAAVAERSGGQLAPDSPWFAMEMARAGHLTWRRPLPWRELRRVLLDLLDALAHAHARGVLHRDIKPANVLFGERADGPPVLKLADFGMGFTWRAERSGRAERIGGTPQYMAPEQFTGDLALQGPWTDLYAVGCLTFALVCGRTPYRGSWAELRSCHRDGPFPTLDPRIAVPAGLDAWIARATSRPCGERFTRAADAAWALRQLPDASDATGRPEPRAPDSHPGDWRPTGRSDGTRSRPPSSPTLVSAEEGELAPVALPVRQPPEPPPVPPGWRGPAREPRPLLAGAGLGLFGVRSVPLVGREAERDELWRLLCEVRTSRRPQAVVLRGPTGCGKTRLAEWVCETAEELGVALSLRASHHGHGDRSGVGGMIARHFRLPADLGGDELLHWLLRALSVEGVSDPDEARRLLELGSASHRGPRRSAGERHGAIERFVRRVAGSRAVVVSLDDVHADPESVVLVSRLLKAADLPALLVVTTSDDAMAAHRPAALALELLAASPAATTLRVDPLSPSQGRELVRGLLGVADGLADTIERRSAGHPLFAVQLVADWVQRGRLVAGPDGFVLAPGDAGRLPATLTELWEQRIAGALAGHPEWRSTLLAGAVLGREVARDEWSRLCAVVGAPEPAPLFRRLVDLGLAFLPTHEPDRLVFVHDLLREVLLDGEPPRVVVGLHRQAAQVLSGRPDTAERRARHLLDAGDPGAAFRPAMEAVDARVFSGQPDAALALLDRIEPAVGATFGDRDPRFLEILAVRAQTLRVLARLSEAVALAERAAAASTADDARVHVLVLRELAVLLLYTAPGGPRLYQLLEEAARVAELAGFTAQVPAILVQRGRAAEYHGRLAEAHRDFTAARALLAEDAGDVPLGDVEIALAGVAAKLGRYDEALATGTSASERFARSRLPFHQAYAETLIGEVLRGRGDLVGAEAAYRSVIARYEAIGAEHAALVRANLGIVLAATGRYAEAVGVQRRARAEAVASGHHNLVPMVELFLAWAHAGLGDLGAFDEDLATAEQLPAMQLFDPDLAAAAFEAAKLVGEPERARRAARLARTLYAGLDAGAEVERVDAWLAALTAGVDLPSPRRP